MKVREPAVAGRFYTGEAGALAHEVDAYLAGAPATSEQPPGVIVPHAGHIYSGPVAAHAFNALHEAERVVLIGPAHYVPVRGCVAPEADVWRTPLGDVEVDAAAISELGVHRDDRPHAPEHSLEVQLPFLQRALAPGWRLLPLLVGRAQPQEVADRVQGFLVEPSTAVVVSTDLSHYLPYEAAVRRDRETADRIIQRQWDQIADEDACGAYPLRGVLLAAQRLRLPVTLLDLRNSGDTAGPRDRVVGYGAFEIGA